MFTQMEEEMKKLIPVLAISLLVAGPASAGSSSKAEALLYSGYAGLISVRAVSAASVGAAAVGALAASAAVPVVGIAGLGILTAKHAIDESERRARQRQFRIDRESIVSGSRNN